MSDKKMRLCIDAGTTSLRIACFEGGQGNVIDGFFLDDYKSLDAKDLFGLVSEKFGAKSININSFTCVSIACVALDFFDALLKFSKDFLRIDPHIVSYRDLKSAPSEAGADRVSNALCLSYFYKNCPALVVDLGTATAFDLVEQEGILKGCSIAPGWELFMKMQNSISSNLPNLDNNDLLAYLRKKEQGFGVDTKIAMMSGLLEGFKGMVEGIVNSAYGDLESNVLHNESGLVTCNRPDMKLFVTGGNLTKLNSLFGKEYTHDLYLTLRGVDIAVVISSLTNGDISD